jgi:hypothetical protein
LFFSSLALGCGAGATVPDPAVNGELTKADGPPPAIDPGVPQPPFAIDPGAPPPARPVISIVHPINRPIARYTVYSTCPFSVLLFSTQGTVTSHYVGRNADGTNYYDVDNGYIVNDIIVYLAPGCTDAVYVW